MAGKNIDSRNKSRVRLSSQHAQVGHSACESLRAICALIPSHVGLVDISLLEL
jgi:hypothetical protein